MQRSLHRVVFFVLTLSGFVSGFIDLGSAQDKSVNPGINDSFANPDVKSFQEKFEVESREVFNKRHEILAACGIDTLLCQPDSTELPPESVDVAFICDTYHHFEYPKKTMSSLYQAMKPGGRVIVIDFQRVEGESSDWVTKLALARASIRRERLREDDDTWC